MVPLGLPSARPMAQALRLPFEYYIIVYYFSVINVDDDDDDDDENKINT